MLKILQIPDRFPYMFSYQIVEIHVAMMNIISANWIDRSPYDCLFKHLTPIFDLEDMLINIYSEWILFIILKRTGSNCERSSSYSSLHFVEIYFVRFHSFTAASATIENIIISFEFDTMYFTSKYYLWWLFLFCVVQMWIYTLIGLRETNLHVS